MKQLFDTNILVDETLEDSERHTLATKLFDESETIILPRVVLLEYVWVMLKRVKAPPDFLVEKVSEYRSDARVNFYCETEDDVKLALLIMKREKMPASAFNDCLLLAIAKNNKAEILTFDDELKGIARKYVTK
ncbi:MAG: PIN domain-containing protein [Thermoproteota archaeon]